jgi:uncharacterized iron-regulated membrane protein
MSFRQRWLKQPQSTLVRKVSFQIHLWAGIGVGLYVFVVCVTGSALVFRVELANLLSAPVTVEGSGTPLSDETLSEAARRAYPGYQADILYRSNDPKAAVVVSMVRGDEEKHRLFDPFTGEDLGPSVRLGMKILAWTLDLHDNLLAGETGRLVNGVGGLLLALLALTGAVIWWPGIKNWKRSLTIHRGVNWKRFTWDLHSSMGFWAFAMTFMWAVTGFYLVYQEWFAPILDYIEPYDEVTFKPRLVDDILIWLPRLHFGRFRGVRLQLNLLFKTIWVIVGLAPAILFMTGSIMWWNRSIRKVMMQSGSQAEPVQFDETTSEVVEI